MGWLLLLVLIPVALLVGEMALSPVFRARRREMPRSQPSAEGPYRDARPLPPAPVLDSYAPQWARFRQLEATSSRVLWILIIPVAVVIQYIFGGGDAGGVVAMVFIAIAVIAWVTMRHRLVTFPCPRCQQRFIAYQSNDFSQCAHCHLRRDAPGDPDAAETR